VSSTGTSSGSSSRFVATICPRTAAEFRAGDGTLVVYESVGAGQSRATVAGFRVTDIDAAVSELRGRGVTFEDYEMPDLKTENGIVTIGDLRAAWAKDPDGKIIAFESRTAE
jgi:hypothetical protein